MDVRLSAEQLALKDSALELVDSLGPRSVMQLDDAERSAKLDAAITAVGWRELRVADEDGAPVASAVEAALIAQELARGLADASFLGPTLAGELRRLAGAPPAAAAETVALVPGLARIAVLPDEKSPCYSVAIDSRGCSSALVLLSGPSGYELASVPVAGGAVQVDLTRFQSDIGGATAVRVAPGRSALTDEQLTRWTAFALAMTCADLVGTMAGAVNLACEYAKVREQFGTPIGAFQAIQHKLADAFVAAEGSYSVALHAAWAADMLPARDAHLAACVAKAYCSRAARAVCEAAIQVHGGIGNTWECSAHLYLRRALLTTQMLGGAGGSLQQVLAYHLDGGSEHGLR
jgi:alkylation response protein AidB-like acyl-CoA dehydrogenase